MLIATRWDVVGLALAAAVCSTAADARAADAQLRPFVGFTFAGDTSFSPNLAEPAGNVHGTIGIGAAWLGNVFGVEAEIAHTPGIFESSSNSNLVIGSSATTIVGDLIVAFPGRMSEYTLRPYVLGGGGLMRATMEDTFEAFAFTQNLPAFDFGAGVVGFLTKRVGVAWEIRRFQSVGGRDNQGISLGTEQLSFWRATMAVAIRY